MTATPLETYKRRRLALALERIDFTKALIAEILDEISDTAQVTVTDDVKKSVHFHIGRLMVVANDNITSDINALLRALEHPSLAELAEQVKP